MSQNVPSRPGTSHKGIYLIDSEFHHKICNIMKNTYGKLRELLTNLILVVLRVNGI